MALGKTGHMDQALGHSRRGAPLGHSSQGNGGNQESGSPGLERKQGQEVSRGFLSRFLGSRWNPVGLGKDVMRLGNLSPKSS